MRDIKMLFIVYTTSLLINAVAFKSLFFPNQRTLKPFHKRQFGICSFVPRHHKGREEVLENTFENNSKYDNDTQLKEKESSSLQPYLTSQAKTANFMLYWPSITTFTLVKGWNKTATSGFKHAVNEAVNENPILTGRASQRGRFGTIEIMITPGAFPTNKHHFVNVIDSLDTSLVPTLSQLNGTEILEFMDEFIAPIVPKTESVIESIHNGSPLFGVDVIHLPDEYACYVVKMSHCVGDGTCYFKIMDRINQIFNKKRDAKKGHHIIEWRDEQIANHEIFPEKFSSRDRQIMYGLPFVLGLLRNVYNIKKQKKGYFLLSKQKIQNKKKEFVSMFHGNVSSNDIITSALVEANLATEIFAFTMNMRSLHCNFGGNYHNEVPFPKKAVLFSHSSNNGQHIANPRAFRDLLKKGFYFERDELPMCPFVLGTVGRVSSLASVQKLILKEDMTLVCHCVLSSFVSNIPMDTAFISSMNEKCFVVLHNFRDVNYGGLLSEISL